MISNQVIAGSIDTLAGITKVQLAVFDSAGVMLHATASGMDGYADVAKSFVISEADSQNVQGAEFIKVIDDGHVEYIVVAVGDSASAMVCKIAGAQLLELIVAYKERLDKESFIKNLLLDNLLLVDIFNRSKKLHIDIEAKRVVLIVEVTGAKEGDEIDRVRSVFVGRTNDFVTAVDERNIVVVHQLENDADETDVEKICQVVIDAFGDRRDKVRVSYGTMVTELKGVSRSYKEASLALDVGKIFFSERNVIAYSVLGIGRLIYQLPIPLCKMFISEIFEEKSPDEFDEETIVTINKFFENSLNVSETSRQLYIHRNTLVYRLDKLQKSTGLDLRVFEDAITFKIALMVVKYMKYMENSDF